jgi:hypothetical protein
MGAQAFLYIIYMVLAFRNDIADQALAAVGPWNYFCRWTSFGCHSGSTAQSATAGLSQLGYSSLFSIHMIICTKNKTVDDTGYKKYASKSSESGYRIHVGLPSAPSASMEVCNRTLTCGYAVLDDTERMPCGRPRLCTRKSRDKLQPAFGIKIKFDQVNLEKSPSEYKCPDNGLPASMTKWRWDSDGQTSIGSMLPTDREAICDSTSRAASVTLRSPRVSVLGPPQSERDISQPRKLYLSVQGVYVMRSFSTNTKEVQTLWTQSLDFSSRKWFGSLHQHQDPE